MGYNKGEGKSGWNLLLHINPRWALAALAVASLGAFVALNTDEGKVFCDTVTGCLDAR
jgi:hypothetical protein